MTPVQAFAARYCYHIKGAATAPPTKSIAIPDMEKDAFAVAHS